MSTISKLTGKEKAKALNWFTRVNTQKLPTYIYGRFLKIHYLERSLAIARVLKHFMLSVSLAPRT
jgi:hypothetical protein